MEQEMNLVLKTAVVNDFSFPFSKKLFEKLKKLKETNRIFKKGGDKTLTNIASSVIEHLGQQIKGNLEASPDDIVQTIGVDEFISTVKEFLAIFETKRDKK